MIRLPREFYARATVDVARDLLGQRLTHLLDGERLSGLICETEAYGGADDQASHAFRRTARSAIMFGPAGIAYVYFIYGMHFCLNAVTEREGAPGAVLIRALIPEEGVSTMRSRRGPASAPPPAAEPGGLAAGPGRLCQALGLTREHNGLDLVTSGELFIEAGMAVPHEEVARTPRVGVRGDTSAVERTWRFLWRPLCGPLSLAGRGSG